MGVVTALAVGAAASLAGGAIAGGAAGKAARRARSEKQRAEAELRSIKNSRQQITNPYASTEDLSSLATDLSSQLSNPFENLGVATKAAEIQIEQADISLANTLDTIRATGASAGGATALAQAALKSKQGVSASIEQQEAQNQKLRAQGETQKQQALINIESQAISAEERAAAGEDDRVQAELDRAYGEVDFLRSRQLGLEDAGDAALMAGISGSTSALTSAIGPGGSGIKGFQ